MNANVQRAVERDGDRGIRRHNRRTIAGVKQAGELAHPITLEKIKFAGPDIDLEGVGANLESACPGLFHPPVQRRGRSLPGGPFVLGAPPT